MPKFHRALILLLPLLLAACATGPKYETSDVAMDITPGRAAVEGEVLRGKRVIWGGTIVASTNLAQATRLEVLAYPLDSSQRPQTSKEAGARFLILHSGYLETVDYAPGRLVTVRGLLAGTDEGMVGEKHYTYPRVEAEQLYLWPKASEPQEPRLQFGIGVMFGR